MHTRQGLCQQRVGAAGAAGAATKSAIEWNKPDQVSEEHVKLSMERRGHAVLGWR